MKITEEMIGAGVSAFESAFNGSPNSTEMVTTILSAALSAIEPAGVVKPEAKHQIVAASRVYEVLKKYRDQGRFDWDYIGYICRDVAALTGDEQ